MPLLRKEASLPRGEVEVIIETRRFSDSLLLDFSFPVLNSVQPYSREFESLVVTVNSLIQAALRRVTKEFGGVFKKSWEGNTKIYSSGGKNILSNGPLEIRGIVVDLDDKDYLNRALTKFFAPTWKVRRLTIIPGR